MFNFNKIKNEKLTIELFKEYTEKEQVELRELVGRGMVKHLTKESPYSVIFTEDVYNKIDGKMSKVNEDRTIDRYIIEIKAYYTIDNQRKADKHNEGTFMIDHEKCRYMCEDATKDNYSKKPLLIGLFSDGMYIWDLRKTDWRKNAEWRPCEKKGVKHGEKELSFVTHLPLEQAIYVDHSINIDYYYEHVHYNLFNEMEREQNKNTELTEDDNLPF
jgi:hypothetical protein